MLPGYTTETPKREQLEATTGLLLIEFGRNDCGICQRATPLIAAAMSKSQVPHLRIEDARGRRLGRSFGVKLWPTLILLQDGREVARVVRPDSASRIDEVLNAWRGARSG